MAKSVINSGLLAPTLGAYSHGVRVGDLVFLSGAVGCDSEGRLLGSQIGRPDMGRQTEGVLDNLDNVLSSAGATRDDVVSLLSFIADWKEAGQYWDAINRRYGNVQPALSTVGQSLAQVGMTVEIEGVAVLNQPKQRITLPQGITGPPAAVGVRADNMVFLSGIAGIGTDGQVVPGGIRAQTAQALENVRKALAQAGATPRDVIKTHTTIADWRDFDGYNEVYAEFFGQPYPARASILGTLQDPARLIEFSMMAIVGGDRTYVDTATAGRYQTKDDRPGVLLDARLSPGVAPHCQAVRVGDFIAVSGMVATDLEGKLIGSGDIAAQTDAVLQAIKVCTERLGSSLDDVVKTLVTVVDWRHFPGYNAVYGRYFPAPHPARSSIQGGLAQYGLLIEIEAFAVAGAADFAQVIISDRAR